MRAASAAADMTCDCLLFAMLSESRAGTVVCALIHNYDKINELSQSVDREHGSNDVFRGRSGRGQDRAGLRVGKSTLTIIR